MNRCGGRLVRGRIDNAVRALCPLIRQEMSQRPPRSWSEYELRRELVGCILGSQVSHKTATAATANLQHAGLLEDRWWSRWDDRAFGPLVLRVLAGSQPDLPHPLRYRFFRARAGQLVKARDALAHRPLKMRLAGGQSPWELRRSLVADIAGVGPKQASMFLRNAGMSDDLAILDRHVLRFMHLQGLLPSEPACTSTLAGYERTEPVVIAYARAVGYPVGYVDLAIWVTMKAARELGW